MSGPMTHSPADPIKAYNKATHTVSKTRQVVMLYDGAIRFTRHAIEAIERKDFEARYHKLTRVSEIMVGLQSCLDFEAGGTTARMLSDFYSSVDARIFTIHRTNDLALCEAVLKDLKHMRDEWDRIDRQGEAQAPAMPANPAAGEAQGVIVSA
jgi:flagellar secretion chaperone FliS